MYANVSHLKLPVENIQGQSIVIFQLCQGALKIGLRVSLNLIFSDECGNTHEVRV